MCPLFFLGTLQRPSVQPVSSGWRVFIQSHLSRNLPPGSSELALDKRRGHQWQQMPPSR